jgi:hypothetical protein
MIIGWSCTKLVNRLPIGNSRWLPQVWFKSVLWFQKKRWKCEIPIGSNVKLSRVMVAILNFWSANDSHFLYRTTQWSFLKIFLLETTKPIELWLCRNDHWVVLYKKCESLADQKFKMATMTRLSLTWFLKFRPIRTHYGPWQPCWISDQRQKQNSCIWPSSEHFCQVWFKSVLWQHGCQGP